MTTSNSQYVFSPWLTPVRLVQTSNLAGTYYNGPNNNGVGATFTYAGSSLTIDSVVCNLDDRVALVDQSSGYQNGIYVVQSIGSTVVLQRAEDQQCIEQIQTGQYFSVKGGSVNAGSFFSVIEPRPQVLGTSNIVYSTDPASGAAVTFSGGPSVANALAVYSNTAGDIKPQTTASTLAYGLTITTGNLGVSDGSISSGLAAGGFVGLIEAFPTTASSGFIALQGAVNSSGNFGTTLSNQTTQAQAQVLTFPDVGAATGNVLAAGGALVSGNFVQASGTSGAVVDSGVSVATSSKVASITLTAAQINALYDTPIQVIAAPGSGKVIIVTGLAWDFVYGSAAFTSGGVVTLQYKNTAHAGGVLTTTGIAAASITGISANSVLTDTAIPVVATSANTVNQGIYISNATQDFATGTGTTSTLSVFYRVISAT